MGGLPARQTQRRQRDQLSEEAGEGGISRAAGERPEPGRRVISDQRNEISGSACTDIKLAPHSLPFACQTTRGAGSDRCVTATVRRGD